MKRVRICICKICHKEFSPKNLYSGKGYFCSKSCYGRSVARLKRPGIGDKISKTKKGKGTYKDFPCKICGKVMTLTPCWWGKRITCSRECMGKIVSKRLVEMWKNPKDWFIEKLRAGIIKSKKLGNNGKETKPEKVFREALEKRKK